MGKTRLGREALLSAAQRGAVTRWVQGTVSARGLPLGAFGDLLGGVAQDSTQVLGLAAEAVVAGAGSGVVIGVDDAHLLDELSALLVHRLVLRAEATMVVTVRSGEPVPDAISTLWKDGHLRRVDLQPLSRLQTAGLLEAVLDGPVDSGSAERVFTLTQGNVLYLWHLVVEELAAGRFRKIENLWRWSGEPVLSPSLVELLADQMGALTEELRYVVDVLALAEPLGVAVLVRLAGAAAVEEAEQLGLVSVERNGRRLMTRLAHPLYGEVRQATMGMLRARRLRGQVAAVLVEIGGRRAQDTLRCATLVLDSDLDPDPGLLVAGTSDAVRLIDLDLAHRLARAAVAAGGGFEAQLMFGTILSWLSRGADADAELSAVAALAMDDLARARAAVPRAANLFWTLGRPADAEAVLNLADTSLTGDDARPVLTAVRAVFHAFLGRPLRAMEAARAALEHMDLPDQAITLASWGQVTGLGVVGRADDVAAAASHGYEATSRSLGAGAMRFSLTDSHLDALQLAGYLDEAERLASARRDENLGAPASTTVFVVALLGRAALAKGQVTTAVRWLREARAGLTEPVGRSV